MQEKYKRPGLPIGLMATMVIIISGCASTPGSESANAVAQLSDAEIAAQADGRLDSDPNKKTCRTIRPTGSRIGERVCRANHEWAKIEAESRAAIGRVQQDQNASQGEDGG